MYILYNTYLGDSLMDPTAPWGSCSAKKLPHPPSLHTGKQKKKTIIISSEAGGAMPGVVGGG